MHEPTPQTAAKASALCRDHSVSDRHRFEVMMLLAAKFERELAESLAALRSLHDEQNGAPLIRRETQWLTAMNDAQLILAKHNA